MWIGRTKVPGRAEAVWRSAVGEVPRSRLGRPSQETACPGSNSGRRGIQFGFRILQFCANRWCAARFRQRI